MTECLKPGNSFEPEQHSKSLHQEAGTPRASWVVLMQVMLLIIMMMQIIIMIVMIMVMMIAEENYKTNVSIDWRIETSSCYLAIFE